LKPPHNHHIASYAFTDQSLIYATKCEPYPPEPEEEPSISLKVNPRRLNLRSRGRWMTAYLSTENASIYETDTLSILPQDLIPERYDYQEMLVPKYQESGNEFEAYDYIRVISRKMVDTTTERQ